MGKVGSSSIYEELCNKTNTPTFQLHRLNYNSENFIKRGWAYDLRMRLIAGAIAWIASKKKEIRVLTITRNPLPRNLSGFFQNLDYLLKEDGVYAKHQEIPSKYLEELFINKYPHSAPITWFDEQVRDVFGIDVFKHSFDKKAGRSELISTKNIKLLVVRYEDLPKNLGAIGEFFDVENFQLPEVNVGANKWYSSHYTKMKRNFAPTPEIDALLHTSNYYQHFYESKK